MLLPMKTCRMCAQQVCTRTREISGAGTAVGEHGQ